jgi:hypothetical protein
MIKAATLQADIKGSPMHVAPTCAGFRKGLASFDLMYAVFPYISARGYFQDLNLSKFPADNFLAE